ncbi:hypothetical protein ACFPZ0_22690 [Streptomonospora nanhaiensis]|uniref:hypothetical protein n=1 Tax=Streptomonospora nanhaiensis TaxID=1323731 RepID=UPI001C995F30|nr:hypothetical protein [Streptomonospora nanhaiensis]MBX9390808.1 hypothetical protein [Streptomonospora nanhaiensis]
MTDGPAPEPEAGAPAPHAASAHPAPPHGPPPPHLRPQQPWSRPAGAGWPGGPPPPPPKGAGLAVAAVVLGLLGCVVPFLPVDLTGVRHYVAFPFWSAGLLTAVLGCLGRRRGKPLAAAGGALSVLALLLQVAMVAGHLAQALSPATAP